MGGKAERRKGGRSAERVLLRSSRGIMVPSDRSNFADSPPMMPYQRWKAWEVSHELVLAIYRETRGWPDEERYGLVSQARRAAVSVVTNLAEGSARRGGRELKRFLDFRLGSLAELSCLLQIARDLGHLPEERWTALNSLRDYAGKLVYGLARSVADPAP